MRTETRFAAVQIKDQETAHTAIGHFMTTAHKMGLRFTVLEQYGELSVGSSKFVRFRTDCWKLPELSQQLLSEGRGTVIPNGQDYLAELPGGRKGKLGTMALQATPLPSQHRKYRGPKLKFWDRQFAA